MKTGIKILLWVLCGVFAYLIYQSITGPIEFQKVKQERFAKVISSLKDIRDSQEAYKTVKGKYAKDFNSLINFVDTGAYTITTQRDTSFMVYSDVFKIDVPKDSVIIDTLGTVAVRDSLFKKDMRYKTMMNVPGGDGAKFDMKTGNLEKGGYTASVFEAKVAKSVILGDQPEDLQERENAQISVEEVNGSEITVGSLDQVSTSGNWPPIYDRNSSKK